MSNQSACDAQSSTGQLDTVSGSIVLVSTTTRNWLHGPQNLRGEPAGSNVKTDGTVGCRDTGPVSPAA